METKNTKLKMNVLLAKTDHLATSFKAAIKDYIGFFKDKQNAFKGEQKTYIPKSGTIDLPSERGNKLVVTTVKEKLDWFVEGNAEYIDALFAQEATNAAGVAKAELIVDGKSWGTYSSLELLRLKSLVESGDLEMMYANIPVRTDDEEWKQTSSEQYQNREIFEGKKGEGVKKSVLKEGFIMLDPNIDKLKSGASYAPTIGQKDTIVELGDYSFQKFSGEWSHRERAELLRRRTILLSGVIQALKIANEVEAIESSITAEKLFSYLHTAKTV